MVTGKTIKAKVIVRESEAFPHGLGAIAALKSGKPVALCYEWSNLSGEDNVLVAKATPIGVVKDVPGPRSGGAVELVAALEDNVAPGRVGRKVAFRLAETRGLKPIGGWIDYIIGD